MVAVIQDDLWGALLTRLLSNKSTINTAVFTGQNSPAFSAANTTFPNGRSEKMITLNGSNQYYSGVVTAKMCDTVYHIWVRPAFDQTYGSTKIIFAGGIPGNNDLIQTYYGNTVNDWMVATQNVPYAANITTVGETWATNALLHFCIIQIYNYTGDGGYSIKLYINNVLKATSNYSLFHDHNLTNVNVGANYDAAGLYWPGEVFDFAMFQYTPLAAKYTDAEIVQSLYSNVLGAGDTHLFACEIADVTPSAGLTINANKLRIYTNTANTPTLAMDISKTQRATFQGVVQAAGFSASDASAGLTTTITTAKLTSGGANGSMVFKNGLLTGSTPAT